MQELAVAAGRTCPGRSAAASRTETMFRRIRSDDREEPKLAKADGGHAAEDDASGTDTDSPDKAEGAGMSSNTPSNKSSSPGFVPEIPRRMIDLPGSPPRRPPPVQRSLSESKRLLVGRDISLSGEITACETLVVEGRVEATLEHSHSLEITDGGLFKGTVQIDEAVIAGTFEGDLTVRDRLLIKATGRVKGKVHFGRLEVELGGEILGEIGLVQEGLEPAGGGADA